MDIFEDLSRRPSGLSPLRVYSNRGGYPLGKTHRCCWENLFVVTVDVVVSQEKPIDVTGKTFIVGGDASGILRSGSFCMDIFGSIVHWNSLGVVDSINSQTQSRSVCNVQGVWSATVWDGKNSFVGRPSCRILYHLQMALSSVCYINLTSLC